MVAVLLLLGVRCMLRLMVAVLMLLGVRCMLRLMVAVLMLLLLSVLRMLLLLGVRMLLLLSVLRMLLLLGVRMLLLLGILCMLLGVLCMLLLPGVLCMLWLLWWVGDRLATGWLLTIHCSGLYCLVRTTHSTVSLWGVPDRLHCKRTRIAFFFVRAHPLLWLVIVRRGWGVHVER